MVSDPCYSLDTWCQTKLSNVLPGLYNVEVEKSDLDGWGTRISSITVIHKNHEDKSNWEYYSNCGVDSGQCGVFCMTSYRNDVIFKKVRVKVLHIKKFNLNKTKKIRLKENYKFQTHRKFKFKKIKKGDAWYEKMCHLTLTEKSWGLYDTGVVTSSGIGDGMYPFYVMYDDSNEIVGMKITYLNDTEDDYEDEDEGDCCGVCGAELESDDTCDYCEHFENSKKED